MNLAYRFSRAISIGKEVFIVDKDYSVSCSEASIVYARLCAMQQTYR